MKNKKGFTLIELLAVIVILAIIALIATPIVLNMINDARVSAQNSTVENIVRAAEFYYSKEQMTGKTINTITFDLSDKNNGLEFDGERPNGFLTLYKDGKTYLNVKFDDGNSYMKLPNEEEIQEGNKVIGSSEVWETDGNGKLTNYLRLNFIEGVAPAYSNYFFISFIFNAEYKLGAQRSMLGYTFDYNISVEENVEKCLGEQYYMFKNAKFPTELQKEIDDFIELIANNNYTSVAEVEALLAQNQSKFPYFMDIYTIMNSTREIEKSKAFDLISKNVEFEDILIIPNYVEHEDGTLEEIKTIGTELLFVVGTDGLLCKLNPIMFNKKMLETNVIISEGIETIESNVFAACFMKNITFASTIETIGEAAFGLNSLDQVNLPSSLKTIEKSAFLSSGIDGKLIIPKNVETIGETSFKSDNETLNCESKRNDILLYQTCLSSIDKINELVFEEGSKINTIGDGAFEYNSLEKIELPGSIKTIGANAFNTSTLRSVVIKRAQGSDLSIGENAFGSATIEYRP